MISEEKIKSRIENKLGQKIRSMSSLSGGCISDAYKLETNEGNIFLLKYHPGISDDMFEKEANGLKELAKSNAIRIPNVLDVDSDYILLEFISSGSKKNNFFEDFGRRFAEMHKYTANEFGFYEDNYIGSNPQSNIPNDKEKKSWISFYFNKRILFQLKLSEKLGNATPELRKGVSKLEEKIEEIMRGSEEGPSILHGDLWGGP